MEVMRRQEEWLANEAASRWWRVLLGPGAQDSPEWGIGSIGVHPQWAVKDAQRSSARARVRHRADGAFAGGALSKSDSGPQDLVGGGNGCQETPYKPLRHSGSGSGAHGGGSCGKDSRGRIRGGGGVGVPGVPELGGVPSMEVLELVGGSVKVFSEFPSVVLRSIALLADQVLESAADHVGVKDLVDLVVILIFDFDRGQLAGALAEEGVWSIFFEELDMEHGMELFQAQG
ncbi:hypothetical protein C0989_010281 [Termitomyces sp. Mn162]|nr:hypothetical protein C0989_010281 [Termitomyces sp. Mn162]